MQSMHNIEKSAFRRFEYVGYGGGQVWRVRKHGCGGWEACPQDQFFGCEGSLRAATLGAISTLLAKRDQP
jgi:hypothetical protein